jgi:hypothetical protein
MEYGMMMRIRKLGTRIEKKKQKYDFIYNNVKIGFEKMKRL